MNSKENLLTPEQVADILQIHVLTVYSYIRRGKLDAVRLGRSYRILPEDLTLFIESNRTRKNPAPIADNTLPNMVNGVSYER